ncbi:protein FAM210B, mitochondrial isoform X3 [Pelobates fuscus]|uniref:protein FAM210B, mitochondrial isoform X1 n=2 Tax=Pelobates fuscus TaxID=191477 RepID=UPI002FE42D39
MLYRVQASMLGLSGLFRSSGLRPFFGGLRGLCAGAWRPETHREPGAVRPIYPLQLCPAGMLTQSAAIRHYTQSSNDPGGTNPGKPSNDDSIKLSKTQQLKKVFKEYGAVAVAFHVGISLVSLGICYVLVSSGLDVSALLLKIGFSETVVQSKLAAGTSIFVLAYAIHKLFAPVRISITLISVPFIVRYFRKIGLFKPPPQAH